MLRTPSAAKRSRRVSMPLSKAGLELSPATSTAHQLPAGMLTDGAAATAWADSGGSSEAPLQLAARPAARAAARRRLNTGRELLGLRPDRAQGHVGIEPRHLLLRQPAARHVPHRDVRPLVEHRHRQRLEIAPAIDLRRIEQAFVEA